MMLFREHWVDARRKLSRISAFWYLFWLYLEAMLLRASASSVMHENDEKFRLNYWFPHINFQSPRVFDVVRFFIQALWLLLFQTQEERSFKEQSSALPKSKSIRRNLSTSVSLLKQPLAKLTQRLDRLFVSFSAFRLLGSQFTRVLLTLFATGFVMLTISLPMGATDQGLMLLLFWAIALWVRNVSGRIPMLLMVLLSVIVSTRYLYWRITQTVNWDIPLDASLGIILLVAEVYAWLILVLGYIQTAWPLQRHVAKLPSDMNLWPSVDVYIPSYNEPLSVVRATILAATGLDWPKDKLNIYVLDDGKREEFKSYCAEIGVGYIVRADNSHAKAGNLNHALTITSGDFVTIFDCDHIPTRGFLQLTLGWFFYDPKLALVQTPHHFFSTDPFERNLSVFRSKPNEGELFYGLIQDGNDMWNAAFFCGSCAVLKRGPLLEVGGIAVETVTEDAHTALKLHRLGYNSAYLNIPLAAGLATESLSAHIGQRIRWARGMAQIFRLDNPLFGKGLNWGQRICYANAMLYFLNGIPRTIFLLAPLAFLLFKSYIVFAPAVMIAMYAIPHLIHSNLANSRSQGQHRHSFWAEMYETVLAWYILRPTTVALFAPQHGKFNVTAKGGTIEKDYFDFQISVPYLVLIGLSLLGAGFGVYALFYGPRDELLTVTLNMVWITYNLIILGGAVAVAEETKQIRSAHRIRIDRPISVITQNERNYSAQLIDYASTGAGIQFLDELAIAPGDRIHVVLTEGQRSFGFPARVVSMRGKAMGVRFIFSDSATEQAFLRATFSRVDAWIGWRFQDVRDQPLSSFREIIGIGLKGYQSVALKVVPQLAPVIELLSRGWETIISFFPQAPGSKQDSETYAA
ncbi:UDP-forming cellulose synthase catalytic subunit [Pseudidiomarina aestuarii]|uniref:Cellulose synthase catalytic subunit [UDP-forming] n=1 Tax=Pseudidiomarina aestuarii TaxID=624146 RepID=A0A2T4D9K6_9GAMM|nr:UDP-forming cellulose synthase catalytic subunit [Pseudidiomarina aestuarii]